MTQRPTFPNSATVTVPERLVLKGGSSKRITLAVRYGLWDHPTIGRVMIDTGYSPRVTTGVRSLPLTLYNAIIRPKLVTGTAGPPPGKAPSAILLTHLHADHVSALRDHPAIPIHADGRAVDHFLAATPFGRTRHGVFAELLPDDLLQRLRRIENQPTVDAPFGLGPAHDVFNDGELLAVPLPGHMRGHLGFLWPKLDIPLLYAADAQWLSRAVMENRPPGPPARWIMHDPAADIETRARIAAFARAGGEVVYCHDPQGPA